MINNNFPSFLGWDSNSTINYPTAALGKRIEPLTRELFSRLMERKHNQGLPYILGITDDNFNSEMDGLRLKSYELNPYSGERISNIGFHTIGKGETQSKYLGQLNEQNTEKKRFLETFFAANEGSEEAQYKLGNMYFFGRGVDIDLLEALRYFQLSANKDNKKAKLKVVDTSIILGDKQLEKGNCIKAIEYYKNALRQGIFFKGFPTLCLKLAELHIKGLGIEKNQVEAERYFKLAADAGHPTAQTMYAYYLERGCDGFKANPLQAIKYYESAAKKNVPQAILSLAFHNATGFIIPQNIIHATYLTNRFIQFNLAKSLNSNEVNYWINVVKNLSPNHLFQNALKRLHAQNIQNNLPPPANRAFREITNQKPHFNPSVKPVAHKSEYMNATFMNPLHGENLRRYR